MREAGGGLQGVLGHRVFGLSFGVICDNMSSSFLGILSAMKGFIHCLVYKG